MSLGVDYEQPDRILEEVAIENGVLFLKLMPAFRTHHLKTGQYLHGLIPVVQVTGIKPCSAWRRNSPSSF